MNKYFLLLFALIISLKMYAQSLYFPPIGANTWETIPPNSIGYCQPQIDSLYNFLEAENTKAFILLKDGKIVLEKYFGTHTQSTAWQWASAGKTITSFMVGLAQQDGYLSITDTSAEYLGQGWTNSSPAQEEKITIRHQLTMTSGLDDGTADPFCIVDTCLHYKADAGLRWAYHNAPYTLLDSVIENAVGITMNAYTTQKLKTPTGMTGTFVPVGFNNVFFSNARSMARFGLLILNKGNWNGNQIMSDTSYFNQMVKTSQALNPSYGYLWWLNGKTTFMVPQSQLVIPGPICSHAPTDMIVAMGKGGQFLNVVPSENMVWLRMGNEPNNSMVPFLLNNDIWEYVKKLTCAPVGMEDAVLGSDFLHLYPNPSKDILNVKWDYEISKIEVINLHGQVIKSVSPSSHSMAIPIKEIASGFYLLKVETWDGKTGTARFVKE